MMLKYISLLVVYAKFDHILEQHEETPFWLLLPASVHYSELL